MVSLETFQAPCKSLEPISSPRISFSADFLDENNFISICPDTQAENEDEEEERDAVRSNAEFEFLSSHLASQNMITADELFSEGKVLPFWQMHHAEKLKNISLKTEKTAEMVTNEGVEGNNKEQESRISWFLDDDPSPRPPKCTVLWKELLRLKKQRASTLSPSSSSSSSSSRSSLNDMIPVEEHKERVGNREKTAVKRNKKGLERTSSATIRIRPMINVPICTQGKANPLPPLFSLRKGRLER